MSPATVDLGHCLAYVEPQEDLQCGAHALHAILGRRACTAPHYLYDDLQQTNTLVARAGDDSFRLYTKSGNYSPSAINHWLYEHTTEDVALVHVMTTTTQRRSMHEILAVTQRFE